MGRADQRVGPRCTGAPRRPARRRWPRRQPPPATITLIAVPAAALGIALLLAFWIVRTPDPGARCCASGRGCAAWLAISFSSAAFRSPRAAMRSARWRVPIEGLPDVADREARPWVPRARGPRPPGTSLARRSWPRQPTRLSRSRPRAPCRRSPPRPSRWRAPPICSQEWRATRRRARRWSPGRPNSPPTWSTASPAPLRSCQAPPSRSSSASSTPARSPQ